MGYWQRFAAPASVDWCEPNYVHSVYVAEWYNTLSSIPIALLGLLAVGWALQAPIRSDPRFAVGGLIVAVVGIGSVAFHGTLLRPSQALDELPMIYSGLTFLYVVRWRRGDAPVVRRRWQAGLLVYAIAFTAAYFVLPQYFVFFIVTYALAVTAIVVQSARISWGSEADPLRKRLLTLAAGAYVGGVALLWVPEHILLPCDHWLQSLQLHAWFHLTSAVGSYAWLVWAVYDRQTVLGRTMQAVLPVPRLESED